MIFRSKPRQIQFSTWKMPCPVGMTSPPPHFQIHSGRKFIAPAIQQRQNSPKPPTLKLELSRGGKVFTWELAHQIFSNLQGSFKPGNDRWQSFPSLLGGKSWSVLPIHVPSPHIQHVV